MDNLWLWSGILLVGLTAFLALLFFVLRPAIQSYSPREARELLQGGWVSRVIDVRSPEEYHATHYHNAINVPLRDLVSALPQQISSRDHALFFYGNQTGISAFRAAALAQELGYSNVRYLRYGDFQNMEVRHKFQ